MTRAMTRDEELLAALMATHPDWFNIPAHTNAPGQNLASPAEGAHITATPEGAETVTKDTDRPLCPAWCTANHPQNPGCLIHDARVGQARIGGEIVRVSLEQVDVPDLDGGWTVSRPGHVHIDAHPVADVEDLTPSQATALAALVDLFAAESAGGASSGVKAVTLRNLLLGAVDMLTTPAERQAS